jgi:hypothetical protein
MSLSSIRTTRTGGFQISSLKVAGLALGLIACEMPPLDEAGQAIDGVEAITQELMSVVGNPSVADRVSGTVEMVFTLQRLDPPAQATTAFFSTLVAGGNGFNPATAGASCGAGIDYVAVTNRPITFAAGVSSTTTSVTVCGDSIAEGNQHLFAKLVDANNQCEGERCLGIGTITDNPGLAINDITVREPVTGGRVASLTLTLSQALSADVTVTATAVSDTATTQFGNCDSRLLDYMAPTRLVTIPQGATSATYDVTVCGDRVKEPTQRFFVDLSGATNATIRDGRGVVTITDTTLQIQF